MSAISLQDISKSAKDYQTSQESNPDVLAGTLKDFADKLNRFAATASGNIRVKVETQVARILDARDSILYHRVGQLSFWGQMVEIEDLAKPILNLPKSVTNIRNEVLYRLKEFYDKLWGVLQKANLLFGEEKLNIQKARRDESPLAYCIFAVRRLVSQLPKDSREALEKGLAELTSIGETKPEQAVELIQSWIDQVQKIKVEAPSSPKKGVEDELARSLGILYSKLHCHLKENGHLPSSMKEQVRLIGPSGFVIPAYIASIQQLVDNTLEDVETTAKWNQISSLIYVKKDEALKILKTWIKAQDADESDDDEALTKDQIASLESAAGSLETNQLRVLLISLPIYDLTSADKVRIVKKAIDQPNLAPLVVLLSHDCFNEMSKEAFDELIAYAAKKKETENHLLLLKSTDGYVRASFR